MTTRKSFFLCASVVAMTLIAGPVAAHHKDGHEQGGGNGHKPPPVTNIRFKLDDHSVNVGDTLTGTVMVASHAQHQKPNWVPFGGATLSLTVDGVEVGTLVTDDTGHAVVAHVATSEGDHVMRVVFAGDELHKRAQRAQGFSVGPATVPDPEPTPEPTPDPLR